jgi:hypothetical protein
MPSRTLEEITARFETLPTAKILALLDALSAGDLDTAAKAGGGVRKAELLALQPGGESGQLLDDLEKQAFFQLSRKLGIALMAALLPALATLRACAEGVVPGEAEPMRDENEKPAQALRIAQTTMLPKLCEQRRIAALALFDLAKELGLFDLAKEYREPDRAAAEDRAVEEAARKQGITGISVGKRERQLRSVR